MRKCVFFTVAIAAALAQAAVAQDDGEMRLRKALEGRQVLVKLDMPAIENGVEMVFEDAEVSYDPANYRRLIKDYGVSVKKGTRAQITGVRIGARGIEIDLNGGGSPGRDWLVGDLRLVAPAPLAKSEREMELERYVLSETTPGLSNAFRTELELERQRRLLQDDRNRYAFERVSKVRSDYIEENRKNWGTKLIIVVRSTKETVKMRDMVKSLAKHVELLPRDTTPQ